MTNKKNGGLLFRLFSYQRNDRPDLEEEDTTPTLKRYFKLLGRRFWKLVSLSIMMLPMILPLLLVFYIYINFEKTPIANNMIFSQLYGANVIDKTPSSTLLLDLFGAPLNIPVFDNTGSYILIGACILFLLVTFGWQNAGATYILRSMVRGEPVFLFSDYFYAIRRNLKQGLVMGILDTVVLFLLGFDIFYFMSAAPTFWYNVGFYGICFVAILYFFMRFYIYLLMVTFELSIRKILKNALIFTMLGIKRNLMAVLGLILLTAFVIVLFPIFGMTPLGIAIPLILPFMYYLGFTSFTTAYAAYPIIDRYMIAPYRSSDTEDEGEEEGEAEETEETTETEA